MKHALFVMLFSLICGSAQAMEFTLNCKLSLPNFKNNLSYQAIKVANKKNGKWVAGYKVRVFGATIPGGVKEFALTPDGSGDEDYTDYRIIDPQNLSGLSGAAVQIKFAWVSLVNKGGYAAFDCRPEFGNKQ